MTDLAGNAQSNLFKAVSIGNEVLVMKLCV